MLWTDTWNFLLQISGERNRASVSLAEESWRSNASARSVSHWYALCLRLNTELALLTFLWCNFYLYVHACGRRGIVITCVSVYLCVCLPVCLSICVSVYLCVCLPVCLSTCVSVCLCVCLSVHKITDECVVSCQPNSVGVGNGWPSGD